MNSARTQWHKDWRLWAVVALMVAAMAAYVLTLDESVEPGAAAARQEQPAAVAVEPPQRQGLVPAGQLEGDDAGADPDHAGGFH